MMDHNFWIILKTVCLVMVHLSVSEARVLRFNQGNNDRRLQFDADCYVSDTPRQNLKLSPRKVHWLETPLTEILTLRDEAKKKKKKKKCCATDERFKSPPAATDQHNMYVKLDTPNGQKQCFYNVRCVNEHKACRYIKPQFQNASHCNEVITLQEALVNSTLDYIWVNSACTCVLDLNKMNNVQKRMLGEMVGPHLANGEHLLEIGFAKQELRNQRRIMLKNLAQVDSGITFEREINNRVEEMGLRQLENILRKNPPVMFLKDLADDNQLADLAEDNKLELAEDNQLYDLAEDNQLELVEDNQLYDLGEDNQLELVEDNQLYDLAEDNQLELVEDNQLYDLAEDNQLELVEDNQLYDLAEDNQLELAEDNQLYDLAEDNQLELVEDNQLADLADDNRLEYQLADLADDNQLELVEDNQLADLAATSINWRILLRTIN
ncbi:hypothetical protein WDU94_010683 [Cyamophila willieti]